MRILASAVAAGLTIMAAPPSHAESETADTATASAERLVCKYRQQTGTRFKTKICKSAAQWDKSSETARREAAELINSPKINPAENP